MARPDDEDREKDSRRDRKEKSRHRDEPRRDDRSDEEDMGDRQGNQGTTYKPVVQESKGEVSMSIEETNKLRASLGLPPLKMDSGDSKKKEQEAVARHVAREQEEKEARAEELKEKIQKRREQRLQQEKLAAVKTLGEAEGEEDDDVAVWVVKARQKAEDQKERERAAATATAARLAEQGRRIGHCCIHILLGVPIPCCGNHLAPLDGDMHQSLVMNSTPGPRACGTLYAAC